MRDTLSTKRVALLHPKIRNEVITLIDKAEGRLPGVAIRIVQGLRTFEEQNALYAQGRTKPGPRVTNAKGGQSPHNFGLALDFALLYDVNDDGKFDRLSWDVLKDFDRDGESDWMEVVEVFEEAGYTWGGRFSSIKDNPHLEKTFGKTWRQLLALHDAGKFMTEEKYVDV